MRGQRAFLPDGTDALKTLAARITDLAGRLTALDGRQSVTQADLDIAEAAIDAAEADIATAEAAIDALEAFDAALVLTGTYTPTLTGMAIGTGGGAANTATYLYVGGELLVEGYIKFGSSGTTFPTAPTVSLPSGFTIVDAVARRPVGGVDLGDTGTGDYVGHCNVSTSTAIELRTQNTSTTYNISSAISTTAPFTWIAGDDIVYQYIVRADSP